MLVDKDTVSRKWVDLTDANEAYQTIVESRRLMCRLWKTAKEDLETAMSDEKPNTENNDGDDGWEDISRCRRGAAKFRGTVWESRPAIVVTKQGVTLNNAFVEAFGVKGGMYFNFSHNPKLLSLRMQIAATAEEIDNGQRVTDRPKESRASMTILCKELARKMERVQGVPIAVEVVKGTRFIEAPYAHLVNGRRPPEQS